MASVPEFQVGADSAIKLKSGGAWAIIKGLNQLKLPSMERSVIEVEEFGRDFAFQLASGGKFGTITFAGNMVKGDSTGQDLVKQYLGDNTLMTNDLRIYLDDEDFVTCDLAKDVSAGFFFSKYDPGQADKNGIYSLSGEIVTRGRVVYMLNHNSSAFGDIAFVAAVTPGTTSATITDASSGFVDDGFAAGQTLEIEGSTSNDGQYEILSVTAGTITLIVADALTSEAAISGTKLHAGVR